jgi:uncharacterized lipoprotein
MKSETQQDREADLYLARQFGHSFVREPNPQQVRADFDRVFKDDCEALEQYEFGVVEEDQKRLALGMSRIEFQAYHAAKQTSRPVKRRSNGHV